MKSVYISAALGAVLLSACASGPAAYAPAQKAGAYGYQQQQIQNDRFQVSFTGATEDEARNLALLRAAEITLDNGYTHFRVIGGGLSGQNTQRSPVSTSVGVGVGSGGWGGTRTNVGLGIGLGNAAGALSPKKFTSNLEIILENGTPGVSSVVYDARQVVNSIQPQVIYP